MTEYEYRHRETYRGTHIDVKAHSSSDLIAKVNAKKDEIDRGKVDDSIRLSLFGELFLDATKKNVVSASWYQDLTYMWHAIMRELGDRPIKEIRPIHLQDYLNSLDLADSTIKKRYDLIMQVFHHAFINGLTPTDYTLGLARPHGSATKSGRSITDYERDVLLDVLNGHRGELFCKLMLYCGLRPSEVQALQWKDINLKNKTVTVERDLKRDGTVGPPKTNAAYRTVPIPDHLIVLLQVNRSDPFEDIFSHNPTWRRRMWDSVRREMNIAMGCRTYRNKLVPPYPLADDFTLYNLRHTYCTDLEKMVVPINIASRFMGHANIGITSKIYTHASTEALEIGRELINNSSADGKLRGKQSV